MERDKINEWIVRFNEGDLKGNELQEFLSLMDEVPGLRQEVGLDGEINRILEEKDILEFREAMLKAKAKGRPGILPGWFLLAASMAILITIGGFIIYLSVFLESDGPQIAPPVVTADDTIHRHRERTDSVPGEGGTENGDRQKPSLIAGNFCPHPTLESLVGEATRADDFVLESPLPSLRIMRGDTIHFDWRTRSVDPVAIRLLNNKGELVRSDQPAGTLHCYLITEDLKPGLYYWKLLRNGQLVTAGKFRLD
jgi:hypothetical protein